MDIDGFLLEGSDAGQEEALSTGMEETALTNAISSFSYLNTHIHQECCAVGRALLFVSLKQCCLPPFRAALK